MRKFSINASPSNNITLGIGFKSALPVLKEKLPDEEIKVTAGQLIPVSLQGGGVGSWSYTKATPK